MLTETIPHYRPFFSAAGTFALLSVTALSPGALAQDIPEELVLEVPDALTCPACEIQFSHVVRLGSTDGKDAMWAMPLDVIRIGTDYILVSETENGRLLLYDSDGKIVDTYEERGEGPRELGGGGRMARLGPTSVAFIDWNNGRFAIIEAGSGKVVVSRTVRVTESMPFQVFSFDQSSVIGVNEFARIADGSRRPLHIYHLGESDARIAASFDAVPGGRLTEAQSRRVAWVDGDHIWSSSEAEYLIRRWGLDGTPDGAFRLRPYWFSGVVAGDVGPPSEPPDPFVNSMWTDDESRLWVFTWRPSNAYRLAWEGFAETARGGELFGSDRPAYHKLWNTNIDVLNPETGELVTSRMWIALVGGVLGEGFIWTHFQDEFGVPRVDVWSVSLATGEQAGGGLP